MASTTKQIWQGVGIDESNHSVSGELLQLDLAAFSIQNDSSTASSISHSCLELAGYCHLSHISLTHYRMLNAITRTSQDLEDYERATALERDGSRVLSLPASCWREIAMAK